MEPSYLGLKAIGWKLMTQIWWEKVPYKSLRAGHLLTFDIATGSVPAGDDSVRLCICDISHCSLAYSKMAGKCDASPQKLPYLESRCAD